MNSSVALATLVAIGAVLCLTACTTDGRASVDHPNAMAPAPTTGSAASPTDGPNEPPNATAATEQLDALRLGPRISPASLGYLRSAFGDGWVDVDGNGCNQRDDVLYRDAIPGTVRVVVQGSCDHDVVAGAWTDPYSGKELRFANLKDQVEAQAIQVDHIVPLAEAWVSGATDWSDERRGVFANDLTELAAVDGPTNASKGSGDPAAWRPRKQFQCDYARRWIAIKTTWDLSVDVSEQRALVEMLGFCAS